MKSYTVCPSKLHFPIHSSIGMLKDYILVLFIFVLSVLAKSQESTSKGSLEIVQLKRITNLLSHTVRHECSLSIINKHSTQAAEWFDFLLPIEHESILGFIGAYYGETPLSNQFLNVKDDMYSIIRFSLSFPLAPSASMDIKIIWVTGEECTPNPPRVKQGTEHRYLFKTSPTLPTIYRVLKQSYNILIQPDQINNYTKLNGIETVDNGLMYTNNNPVQPMTVTNLEIFFFNNFPRLVITFFERRITLSHWHESIQVEEFYDITSASPKLLSEFSRVDYVHSFHRSGTVHPLQNIHIILPKDSYFVSYRDEVGNISTSHLRPEHDHEFLEISPRYPIFGGWNFSFELSYYIPMSKNIVYQDKDSTFHFSMQLAHLFNDVHAQKFRLKVILPDGSNIVRIHTPAHHHPRQDYISTVLSYLDIFGRPCYHLEMDNLVRDAVDLIHVEYQYSSFVMMTKLLLLVAFFFAIFLLMIIYHRIKFPVFSDDKPLLMEKSRDSSQPSSPIDKFKAKKHLN